MPEYVMDRTNMDVSSKFETKFERMENANLVGRKSTSDLRWVPDVVNMEVPVIERNYNGLNFHMQMSDRNLALIRRRTENLRKKDKEIRKRLEQIRQKAKMVSEDSPAKQDVNCFHGASLTSKSDTIKLFPITVVHNEANMKSERIVDSFVQNDTRSVMHGIPVNRNEVCGVISSDSCPTSQTETGSLKYSEQLNHKIVCDIILAEENVTPCQNIGREVFGNQLNNNTAHDAIPTEDKNVTDDSKHQRGRRPVPAKRRNIKKSLTTTNQQEHVETKSPLKWITNESVDEKPVRSPQVKLRSFVGERFAFDRIKTMTNTCSCVKETDVFTPKRKCPTASSTHQYTLVQMASPTSLGVSPVRLQLHKSAKKTRMVSMLTSPLIGNMKMTVTKTILNNLKKDRRRSQVF